MALTGFSGCSLQDDIDESDSANGLRDSLCGSLEQPESRQFGVVL
jgi:hypothetical protein